MLHFLALQVSRAEDDLWLVMTQHSVFGACSSAIGTPW